MKRKAFFHSRLFSPSSDMRIKRALFFNRTMTLIFFRLNIPPFVTARSVLEGLESDDLYENEKPVKDEISDAKVKRKQTTGAPVSHRQTLTPECFCFVFFKFSNNAFLSYVHKTSNRAKQKKMKAQTADLLRLCHTVPLEVVGLGGF